MGLYSELERNQRNTGFTKSSEYRFFRNNASVLSSFEAYSHFFNATDTFDVVRANILIRAIRNKVAIENIYVEKTKEGLADPDTLRDYMNVHLEGLPYMTKGDKKVYVPIFPLSLNRLYSEQFHLLGENPYTSLVLSYEAATIDPFDYYGIDLFDSLFTKLVVLKRNEKCLAAFDFDANAIYFINDEGRCDAKVCIFDRGMENPTRTHLLKRVVPVAEAYMNGDRQALIEALREGKLVSEALLRRIERKSGRAEEGK